jgi:hypothetical protein
MKSKGLAAVSWTNIRGYFRQSDIDCMKKQGLDLSDCKTVGENAAEIYIMLSQGRMPPDGKWPQNQIDDFRNWMGSGCPCV